MMKLKYSLIAILVYTLSSCASVNSYHSPQASPRTSVVSGNFVRYSLGEWKRTILASIDNKNIDDTLQISPTVNVLSGEHLFVVNSLYSKGVWTNGYTAYTEIKANILPGRHYHFNNQLDGSKFRVWLENERNQRVSEVVNTPIQILQQPTIVPMPIILPH